MKLTVEIKDNKFEYTYKVGSSEYNSSSQLSVDFLSCFARLLDMCHSAQSVNLNRNSLELQAKAWVKSNPDQAKELMKV